MSKTPILQSKEFVLEGKGWTLSSTIRIETKIKNKELTFYSLHIPGSAGVVEGSVMKNLVDVVLMKDTSKRIIVMGDFNDLPETNAMQYIFNSGFKSVWDDVEDAEQYIDKYKYGQIDNILINKNSGMKAEIAYSIFKKDIRLNAISSAVAVCPTSTLKVPTRIEVSSIGGIFSLSVSGVSLLHENIKGNIISKIFRYFIAINYLESDPLSFKISSTDGL